MSSLNDVRIVHTACATSRLHARGTDLRLGDAVRGHLDDGEVALADGAAHLVEADPQRLVRRRRGRDRAGGDQGRAVRRRRVVGQCRRRAGGGGGG